ncbi:MAG: hypothetical protein JXR96_28770 [Deltaproteobacteria bacterium]|nr:hypothetical protein [Deltaproteobacteria bacterium]
MRTRTICLLASCLAALALGCNGSSGTSDAGNGTDADGGGDNGNGYVQLEHAAFIDGAHEDLAAKLAQVLGVGPATFDQRIDPGALAVGSIAGVEEGFDYRAANDAHVTVWVDAEGRPHTLSYLLRRMGASEDHAYGLEAATADVRSILEQMEVPLDGSEDFTAEEYAAGPSSKWFHFEVRQKYAGEILAQPSIQSELEGSSGEVNFLRLPRWYANLDEIDRVLSDGELEQRARDYYEASDKVISIPDSLTLLEYHILGDALCRRVGSATIDQYGSTMDLLIDVQSGEIVAEEEHLVG